MPLTTLDGADSAAPANLAAAATPVHPKTRTRQPAGSRLQPKRKGSREHCSKHNPFKPPEQRACPACAVLALEAAADRAREEGSGGTGLGLRAARLMAQSSVVRTYRCAGCAMALVGQPELLRELADAARSIEAAGADQAAKQAAVARLKVLLKRRLYPTTKCPDAEHRRSYNGGWCLCGKLWQQCRAPGCCQAYAFAGLGLHKERAAATEGSEGVMLLLLHQPRDCPRDQTRLSRGPHQSVVNRGEPASIASFTSDNPMIDES